MIKRRSIFKNPNMDQDRLRSRAEKLRALAELQVDDDVKAALIGKAEECEAATSAKRPAD